MYGITSKTARIIAIAGLALGIAAIATPAAADGNYNRGHGGGHGGSHGGKGSYGKSGHGHHGAQKQKHAYKRGYKQGYRNGHSNSHGHRRNHAYWRKHGHHGVSVYAWKPFGHRPAYAHRRIQAACHPVVGNGRDHFGRRAKFGGTMCYDRFGYGYVVAGSRHVIHYYLRGRTQKNQFQN